VLQLYIANKNYSSWSLRPWVLMQQLNMRFEERLVPFANGGQSSPFAGFSPTGRVPCLVDGGLTVWDSLAIAEYLAESDTRVWPADKQARAWARCAAAEMHSGFSQVRNACAMNCGLRISLFDWPAALLSEWSRIDQLWRDGLGRFGGPFLAGPAFCAVDAFFAPVAFRVQTYAPPLSADANAYVQRLLDLPSMAAWYASALDEAWREDAHEAEARQAGTWLQDLRRPAA
jgi:glutathione S-transferase